MVVVLVIFYVAHKYGGDPQNIERVKAVLHFLQTNDLENAYFSPVTALSHLNYKEVGYEEEMALCYDFLTVSDGIIVASEISEGVRLEIDLAKRLGMEVRYLHEIQT